MVDTPAPASAHPEPPARHPPHLQIVLNSGISTGCLVAVALNLIFHHLGRRKAAEPDDRVQRERVPV